MKNHKKSIITQLLRFHCECFHLKYDLGFGLLGRENAMENIVGKRKNAGNQHFFFFPQCFLPFQR